MGGRGLTGPVFATTEARFRVRRASILSIVLLLAIGQDSALLCRILCQPAAAAMATCHDRAQTGTTLRVTGPGSCGSVAATNPILMRDNPRPGPDQDTRAVAAVSRYQVSAPGVGHYGI